MNSLHKLAASPLSREEVDQLTMRFLDFVRRQRIDPYKIYLFGSAATYQMKSTSDLDVVFLFETEEQLKRGKKAYYSDIFSKEVSVDALFVTQEDFAKKSKIGGVFFMCVKEGRVIYERG